MQTQQPTKSKQRTWSAFGNVRRMPSEYEIVTHGLNWTTRRDREAALEQNPSSASNLWFLTFRDQSPLKAEDWQGFRDPEEFTYRKYVTLQDEQETLVAGVLNEYATAGHDKKLAAGWRQTLAALFATTRYPLHAFQMCQVYMAHMAPSSYITNCASFAAGDTLRRVSLVAYRTRELQRSWGGDGFGTGERDRWENDPQWQDTRKALELALVAYDWAESFVATNLVLGPTLDDLLLRQLAEVARDNHDDQTWLLLSNLEMDAQRSRRWSAALAHYAIKANPDNLQVLQKWVAKWAPRADAAVAGLAGLLERLPEHGRPASQVVEGARRARETFLAGALASA